MELHEDAVQPDAAATQVHCRAWREGRLVHERVPLKDVVAIAHDPDVRVWVDIIAPTQKTVEALMSLELPAGVEIEIKL